MCEEKQSSEVLRLGGGFWEGGLGANEKMGDGVYGGIGGTELNAYEEGGEEEEEQEWEKEVVGTLESLGAVGVLEGYAPLLSHSNLFSNFFLFGTFGKTSSRPCIPCLSAPHYPRPD